MKKFFKGIVVAVAMLSLTMVPNDDAPLKVYAVWGLIASTSLLALYKMGRDVADERR